MVCILQVSLLKFLSLFYIYNTLLLSRPSHLLILITLISVERMPIIKITILQFSERFLNTKVGSH